MIQRIRIREYQLAALAALLLPGPFLVSRHHDRVTSDRQVDATHPELISRGGVVLLDDEPMTGQVIERWPDGSLRTMTEFAGGRRHGVAKAWFVEGQPMYERWYEEGLEEGTHRGWWEDGSVRFVYEFDLGVHEGSAREWYPNGSLYRDFHYAKGKELGRQRMWHADGTLRANYVVKDGRRFGLIGSKGCVGSEPVASERVS